MSLESRGSCYELFAFAEFLVRSHSVSTLLFRLILIGLSKTICPNVLNNFAAADLMIFRGASIRERSEQTITVWVLGNYASPSSFQLIPDMGNSTGLPSRSDCAFFESCLRVFIHCASDRNSKREPDWKSYLKKKYSIRYTRTETLRQCMTTIIQQDGHEGQATFWVFPFGAPAV